MDGPRLQISAICAATPLAFLRRVGRALRGATVALALAALAVFAPVSAQAQTSANANANAAGGDTSAAVLRSLAITKLRDLDFGGIIATPAGGTVVLDPTGNDGCTASGVIHVGSVCQAADFGGAGESGRIIRVKTPSEITITGPGTDMLIDTVTIDASPDLTFVNGNSGGNGFVRYRIVSANGLFRFRLGGTLNVNPNQLPGEYTGTFEVRVEYQ